MLTSQNILDFNGTGKRLDRSACHAENTSAITMKASQKKCNLGVAETRTGMKCTECAAALRYTGAKLEVPRHNDIQGWKTLAARLENPFYSQSWISHPDISKQSHDAQHWSRCRLRERFGCAKCDAIKARVVDDPDPKKLP